MRILLVASGAREHAIADALSRSPQKPEIIAVCTTKNPGLKKLSQELHVGNILDFPWVMEIAKKSKPALAIVGPDDPIGNGLADLLEAAGIPTMAPKKSLARIESSKSFARDLLQKAIPDSVPKYRVFTSYEPKELNKFIAQDLRGDYVVKYDALRGGKGVKVSGEHLATIEEGMAYAKECIEEGGRVVVEEKLVGVEFSLLSFVSGTQVVDMPAIQDHKRAFTGDTGPNTGGMGTYTDSDHSLPFLTAEDLNRAKEINRLTAQSLLKECGEPYRGILYGGFIAVKDGIRVIEFNARFGDPEALNVLPLLSSDFVAICQAITEGTLTEALVRFDRKATVCKYLAPESYPVSKDQKGAVVTFPPVPKNASLFFGDVSEDEQGILHVGGSRTAGIVGIGENLAEAEKIAESFCAQVKGPVRHRADIGTAALIEQRKSLMRTVRRS
ncbi:MAG: phosphoribosylamine/glycine ligase [Candidatus Peribacter riflensis]|uniref:phosphoribosylamine--glycine ligase n=1 Tax=Candidatus Peribacter riflensis TaxID=1735162 RepID=A0A0S1SGR9_9BACT|nr:MAG: phosphoribosylamine/glycine ligase [Candidatus Peribacter riflensis]OGJ81125.1 MAG: phosphoribosylamine--glycine ligase [Candidatus Peribacteria bacterium RIFOXYC1_FULL_58_8]ALM10855.1 MAG: phosphoribosylamine/glycine ligase [Candidatus Peribacter riflensis]ALM11957.1 MAG: phosphoribosylamine/glycine ligase [Candidatus Peribacter riflensis]ALM13060.1 MAG: phosphoribosylamine/glycine ligase [Candidatus Peribacter riflensis]